jgi:hypothetical protein
MERGAKMIRLTATISGLSNNETISIDRRNIVSINSKNSSRSDNSRPSFGIISSSGSVQFKDLDGKIEDYANKRILTSNLSIKVYVENTITKQKMLVSDLKTENWRYDSDNRSANVTIKDDLEEWQGIQVDRIPLRSESSAYELYQILRNRTPSKYQFANMDEATEDYLGGIVVKFPYLDSGSLWSQWNKFCEAFGIYIYKNIEGKIVCVNDY